MKLKISKERKNFLLEREFFNWKNYGKTAKIYTDEEEDFRNFVEAYHYEDLFNVEYTFIDSKVYLIKRFSYYMFYPVEEKKESIELEDLPKLEEEI
jgi:hypothetical protein